MSDPQKAHSQQSTDCGYQLMEFEWLLPRMAEVAWPASVLYTWLAKTHKVLGNKAEAERYAALAKESEQ